MKQSSCLREFSSYVSQNVLGMLGLSCYILADTFFVANGVGADGLTALNLAIPIYSFVHGCGLMLGIGGATKYSIFKGQKSQKNANLTFMNTFYMVFVFALLFVGIGLFRTSTITKFLGADEAVFQMTKTYLQVILLFSPAFLLNDFFISFVRNDGNPRLSMVAMLVGSLGNIILDYIFIFPLGLGIFGAVLATGCAPIIGLLILSTHFLGKKKGFTFQKVRPHKQLMISTITLGIPSLIGEVSSGLVIIAFNMVILRLTGNIGVAAYGVVANLSLVLLALYNGIGQGIQPLLSRSYGKRDTTVIRQVMRYAFTSTVLLSLISYVGIFSFAGTITALFNSEHNFDLQQIAVYGLKLYFIGAPFAGCNLILTSYFASTEQALPAQSISLLRGLILILPLTFILPMLAGMIGVWLAFPVTEAVVCIIAVVFYRRVPHEANACRTF